MATITVRDLDESTRAKLRIRAARNGRSMEAEVRQILNAAVADRPLDAATSSEVGFATRVHRLFADIGGADDLEMPDRAISRDPVDLSGWIESEDRAGDAEHDR